MKKTKLMLGDNISSLKKLPDNSVDSIVSDPPYGLSFMNKKWDYDVPSVEFWKEVYRVLKPGGHVLSFGGTRTYHRMVVNIEDAGFEIRDQIMWLYGSGFPKSHNIGKAVDKLEGNDREVVGKLENKGDIRGLNGLDGSISGSRPYIDIDVTKGQSEWEGWGTALKPANEPICVAHRPLSEKSVAENVLKWGTGGINIDGCRVGTDIIKTNGRGNMNGSTPIVPQKEDFVGGEHEGRFPANIILDEIAGEFLDEQSGITKSSSNKWEGDNNAAIYGKYEKGIRQSTFSDKGGASRFFYQAKVSKAERNMSGKCSHPTLKPIQLMSYLCKLVTPPGGIILDPFSGSGSTGVAALLNDFRFVGMEREQEYFDIMEKRVNDFESYREFLKK
jgi:site-specific DNA-methyltransferase (adenine-specific)